MLKKAVSISLFVAALSVAPTLTIADSHANEITGDAAKGKKVFRKCRSCHQLKEGKNKAGPSLHGLFGAKAGQVEGFNFSDEMIASDITWDVETLTAFITKPKDVVPGTKMAFSGLKKPQEVADLIAYLSENTAD